MSKNVVQRNVKSAKLFNCRTLNVRSGRYPGASVNRVLYATDRIKVDYDSIDPSDDWIEVLEPAHGYSLKKYLVVEE